ncbi:MAG: uroporphyrinogen decarboxylase family protein [Armatimonadota bacterium]
MTSRERIVTAMNRDAADQVPVMCQLSMGHYLVNLDMSPAEYWLSNELITEAFVTLAHRYRFDGILINLPGRSPDVMEHVERIESTEDAEIIHYTNGERCVCPYDDLAGHVEGPKVTLEDLAPELLFYEDPHNPGGLKEPPFYYGLEPYEWEGEDLFPEWLFSIIDMTLEQVGDELSVHSEVFSPFTQLMERLGYEGALMALMDDPEKCGEILQAYTEGTCALAKKQAARGVDAVLISSAFAGGGFISRDMYEQFVHPYEQQVAAAVHKTNAKVYTHTCGAIGDRLELMVATGIDGIDTMDPPPLGNTELADAKKRVGDRIFLKGNIDPVNVLLQGTEELVRQNAREKLEAAMEGGGYILSSACSVAPHVEPEKLMALKEVVEEYGVY